MYSISLLFWYCILPPLVRPVCLFDISPHTMYKPLRTCFLGPQSSLCEMIIRKLETPPEESVQNLWFIRWLWRTTGGAALYALAACLVTVVSRICRPPASVTETDETDGDKRKGGPRHLTFGRCCSSSKGGVDVDTMERGVETSALSSPASPTVKTIVASFNAWLFADSKVLWAVLVSKIFEEVSRYIITNPSTSCLRRLNISYKAIRIERSQSPVYPLIHTQVLVPITL